MYINAKCILVTQMHFYSEQILIRVLEWVLKYILKAIVLEWILGCILIVFDLLFGRLECHLIRVSQRHTWHVF